MIAYPHRPTAAALSFALCVGASLACFAPAAAMARSKRGAKRLAMAKFDVGSREVAVIAQLRVGPKSGVAVIRLQNSDVPVCRLLILNGPPRKATQIIKAIRLRVCAAYDKEARHSHITQVQFTNGRKCYLVSVKSRRMDVIAKGVETLRFWGIYADMGAGVSAVFERVSTSFKSPKNKAINQAETCKTPEITVGTAPTKLVITCTSVRMLGGAATRKTSTVQYRWDAGRFVLR